MKRQRSAFVLLVFFAFTVVCFSPLQAQAQTSQQAQAQTQPAAAAGAISAVPTTPELQQFLATLAAESGGLAANVCNTNSDCPAGKLCCTSCGLDGEGCRACMTPIRGRCPMIVRAPSRPSASFVP